MSRREPYAWRFWLPDFDAGQHAPGPQLSAGGRIETIGGEKSIRQSILLLLATAPGERVMHPDYGCNLHRPGVLRPTMKAPPGWPCITCANRSSVSNRAWRSWRWMPCAARTGRNAADISLAYQVRATQQNRADHVFDEPDGRGV